MVRSVWTSSWILSCGAKTTGTQCQKGKLELFIDFRKKKASVVPVTFDGVGIEMVESRFIKREKESGH